MSAWAEYKARLDRLFEAYGSVAIGLYVVLFVGTFLAFWFAILAGYQPEALAGGAGTAGAAYVLTKMTQPLRIAVTLAGTPLLAHLLGRSPAAPKA